MQRKTFTPEELLKRYEKECLKNTEAVQRWKLNHPDRYEAYAKVYQKNYYLENKNRLNALATEPSLLCPIRPNWQAVVM